MNVWVNLYWLEQDKEVIVGCPHPNEATAISEVDPTKPLMARLELTVPNQQGDYNEVFRKVRC